MNHQSKIIGFCYLYIIGLVVAMLAPVEAGWLPWLRIATGTMIGVGVILLVWDAIARPVKSESGNRTRWILLPVLLFGAMLLGYTRYLSANTVPDMKIGEIHFSGVTRQFRQSAPIDEASRLRLQKTAAMSRDLRLRLRGELDARQAVRSPGGTVEMDAHGRWKFRISRLNLESEIITIRADDPVGTEYEIEQPFSRITGIEWLEGPESGSLAVYRQSNHIGSFVRPGRAQSAVTILGRITSDPRVYDFKTVLMITPDYIQFPAGGPYFRVEGGDIQVTVPPTVQDYERFARTEAYGMDVEARGELTFARAEANPGGFNARQFMQNYNIYGLMNLYQARDAAPPIHIVAPEGGAPRTGSPLVVFSLDLRDRILRLFKVSMPFPQSAFIGGVTLGMRYGLQGVEYPGREERGALAARFGLARSESTIADDFRASGVNHVLAVSGLHVTIITAMFIGIFSLMRLPRQFFVPLIIASLVVFAIITGARPSTLRAVIMNSLFLLTWAYLGKGLISSVMIGVPVAAFIILLHNPLVVVDPSFTLSFGAILSLALLTMPVHEILCRLRGNQFLAVAVLVVLTTWIGVHHWALVVEPSFIVPWLMVCAMVVWAAGELKKMGWGMGDRFAFSALPEPVSTFLAAQVAIQVGMMIPLSAYYFCRWPFGGAYANLIAIPLIGVVVQLAAIAGLIGLVPVIGPFLALILNAANWLFTTFFLWLAHVFATAFPYPVVRRPRVVELLVYYLLVAFFIWNKPIRGFVARVCAHWGFRHRRAPLVMMSVLVLLLVSPLAMAPPRDARPSGLHVTVLSVGYGSSIFVESPGGKKILIDAGFVEHERGRRNEAERTILPFLADAGIRRLDALILTSPLPERAAGASYLLNQLKVAHLMLPPVLGGLRAAMSYDQFTAQILDERPDSNIPESRLRNMYEELVGNPEWPRRLALAKVLAERRAHPLNRWAGWDVQVHTLKAGMKLFEEQGAAGIFRIEVLHPDFPDPRGLALEDHGLALRIVYGDFALLVPGSLHYEGQRALASGTEVDKLRSDILMAPHHGAAIPGRAERPLRTDVENALHQNTKPLAQAVRPEKVIFEFGSPRPVLGDGGRSAIGVHEITRLFYASLLGEEALFSTDRDLALIIYSDGRGYRMETQAGRNRARGGEEDAVSDLSVGL